jgi:riboflavin synthase
MFTGLVHHLGTVEEIRNQPPGQRLVIRSPDIAGSVAIGDSVCVNGCCLTAVAIESSMVAFECGPETLARTTLGRLSVGARVNLEQAIKVGERMGGHFVTGHVDTVASLAIRHDELEWSKMWFEAPAAALAQMAAKGSVCLDGVSLTLVDVDEHRFSVALIPHTLANTSLGALDVGTALNVETDVLAKYVQQHLERLGG